MRAGGEKRGNSTDRRRRKLWMLSPEAGFGGNERTVPCQLHISEDCTSLYPRFLTYQTVEADRIEEGGSYRRENIRPVCGPCNKARNRKDPVDISKAELVVTGLPERKGKYLCLVEGAQVWPLARFVDTKHWTGSGKFLEYAFVHSGRGLKFVKESDSNDV